MSPRNPKEELGWRAFVWLDDHLKQPAKLTLFAANETKLFPYLSELLPEGVTKSTETDQVPVEKWRFQMAAVFLAAFFIPADTQMKADPSSSESECQATLKNVRELILREMPDALEENFNKFLEQFKTATESEASGNPNLAMFRSLFERSLLVTEHVRVANEFVPL